MKTITPLLFILLFGFYPAQKVHGQANPAARAARDTAPGQSSSLGPIPRRPAGETVFANGVHLTRSGDNVIILDGGRRYVMSRKQGTTPPADMMSSRSPCGTVKHWLDTHRANGYWRSLSIWWADNCL